MVYYSSFKFCFFPVVFFHSRVVLSMLGVLLYVSHSPVRWNTYMVGRRVYAGGIWDWVTPSLRRTIDVRGGHVFTLSLFRRSCDVIQHESTSKGHHDFCSPRLYCVRPVTPQGIDHASGDPSGLFGLGEAI